MYNDEIEIKSDELQDIIGKRPSWIIRAGITVIFIIVAFFISISYIIKFPYTITSRVVITTKIPPLTIKSKLSGRVLLFIKDNQYVKEGTIMAGIENAAILSDVQYVKNELKEIRENYGLDSNSLLLHKFKSKGLRLGQLQSYYFNLIKAVETENQYKALDGTQKQLKLLSSQFDYYQQINQKNKLLESYHKEDERIAQKRLGIDSTLKVQQVIAPTEYDNSKRSYLQTKLGIENSNLISINNQIQLSALQAQILQLKTSATEREKILNLAVEEALRILEERIEEWEKNYLFIAPNSGRASFVSVWSNNQLVNVEEEVIKIVPSMSSLYCKALVPIPGSGRLATKQNVIIKLDNYPYNEYGILKGKVTSISPVPLNGYYSVTISLPNGLKTTYKKNLPFKQEMQGTGEIITSNVSIMERVFNQLNSILDKTSSNPI